MENMETTFMVFVIGCTAVLLVLVIGWQLFVNAEKKIDVAELALKKRRCHYEYFDGMLLMIAVDVTIMMTVVCYLLELPWPCFLAWPILAIFLGPYWVCALRSMKRCKYKEVHSSLSVEQVEDIVRKSVERWKEEREISYAGEVRVRNGMYKDVQVELELYPYSFELKYLLHVLLDGQGCVLLNAVPERGYYEDSNPNILFRGFERLIDFTKVMFQPFGVDGCLKEIEDALAGRR